MEQLVNDKPLRVQMGRSGWERASVYFSGNVVKEKIETIYVSLK